MEHLDRVTKIKIIKLPFFYRISDLRNFLRHTVIYWKDQEPETCNLFIIIQSL